MAKKKETKEEIFGGKHFALIRSNIDYFISEYPDIKEDLKKLEKNANCSCRSKIVNVIKKDMDKMNKIFAKLSGEELNLVFREKLSEPIVKEFDNITEVESFLSNLKKSGTIIINTSISPNGNGGFVLIVL